MTVRPLRTTETYDTPLRVVSSRRLRRPQLGMWGVYTVVAVIAFFALIYSRTALDGTAFELRELQQQIAVEEERQQQLGLEVARLASPGEIVPAAEEMGLILPDEVIPVAADGVVISNDELAARIAGPAGDVSAAP